MIKDIREREAELSFKSVVTAASAFFFMVIMMSNAINNYIP